jgi:hypothetical protein
MDQTDALLGPAFQLSHSFRPLLDQRNFKGKLEELKTEEKKSA